MNGKLTYFLQKLKNFFLSKKAIILVSVSFAAFSGVFGFSLGRFLTLTSNPAAFFPEAVQSLRQTIVQEGTLTDSLDRLAFIDRSVEQYNLEVASDNNEVYLLSTAAEDFASDVFTLSMTRTFVEGEYTYKIDAGYYANYNYIDSDPLFFYGWLASESEDPEANSKLEFCQCHGDFEGEIVFKEEIVDEAGVFPKARENLLSLLDQIRTDGFTCFKSIGFSDYRSLLNQIHSTFEDFSGQVGVCIIASIVSSIFTTITFMLFLVVVIQYLAYRKRLAVEGVAEMPKGISFQDPVSGEEEVPNPPKDLPPLVPPEDGIDGKTARLMSKWKWKPFIHELIIRAVGLGIIFTCALLTGLCALATNYGWDAGWASFSEAASPAITTFSSLGSFILIIAVVTIIAESHKNLFRSSVLFLTLGLLYYVGVTLLILIFSNIFTSPLLRSMLEYAVQLALPGNIPLGVGIFAFIGFFLFENPSPALINRKLFRALSIIPVAFALTSVVLSYLLKAQILMIPYAVTNLLFIRDPSFLFVGICYEFVIFGLRSRYRKLFGDRHYEIEDLPQIQMVKNVALAGLVVFFNILFFVIPEGSRQDMGFTSIYCIDVLAIPLLLFQKPSKENRRAIWDIIYYVLFFAITMIPGILKVASGFIQ